MGECCPKWDGKLPPGIWSDRARHSVTVFVMLNTLRVPTPCPAPWSTYRTVSSLNRLRPVLRRTTTTPKQLPLSVLSFFLSCLYDSISNNARPPLQSKEDCVFYLPSRQISDAKETRSAQAKRRRQSQVGLLYLQNTQKGQSTLLPVDNDDNDNDYPNHHPPFPIKKFST